MNKFLLAAAIAAGTISAPMTQASAASIVITEDGARFHDRDDDGYRFHHRHHHDDDYGFYDHGRHFDRRHHHHDSCYVKTVRTYRHHHLVVKQTTICG